MKQRLYSELKLLAVVLTVGIAYYIWVYFTGLGIPCILNLKTGLLCPACGITRMIVALAGFDFASAYAYNKLLFVTWPLLVAFILYYRIRYIKTGSSQLPTWANVVMGVYIVILILFGIIRNIV